ncbi:MAG TPA: ABC transporter permease [Blastocatellia bacterium]|nr:ABC transporter permease [Blastocatellia bacterium]
MRWMRKALLRLRSILGRRRVEEELDSEVGFHLEQQIEENVARGMTPDAARRAALRRFGAPIAIKEQCRDSRGVNYVDQLVQDVRYGVRQLRGNPGFTLTALLTLALGIGANTTIFSLTNQVLLRSLPIDHPEQLVVLRSPGPKSGSVSDDGDGAASFSYPMFKNLRDGAGQIADLFATYNLSLSVAGRGQTERTTGSLVSGNYFQVLGVQPTLGRTFTGDDETAPGANPVAVLSYGYWQRRFGLDPSILNTSLAVNGVSLTIVGVTRPGFTGVQVGRLPDLFIPVTMREQMLPNWKGMDSPKDYWLPILGRLKPGVTPARAAAAMAPTYRALLEAQAQETKMSSARIPQFVGKPLLLEPGSQGRQILQKNVRQPLIILMAMAALVLLIACANLASLLLARGAARQREIAVRLALGAARRRLIRQLLTESLLLATIGGALGLIAGLWTLKALIGWLPRSFGAVGLESRPDLSVLGFALGASAVTGILFGLAPAVYATRSSLGVTLKEQGASISEGGANLRLRKVLITGQIGVTAVLLIGAGLFARSLNSLNRIDLGLKPEGLMTFSVSPALNRYTPAQTAALATNLTRAIGALPGVKSASAAEIAILSNNDESSNITLEGYTAQEDEDMSLGKNYVGPGFFSTIGIPLIGGREFNEGDTATSPKVAIVNEAFARRFFPGRNPSDIVGSRFAFGAGSSVHPDIQIVGVVKDSKTTTVKESLKIFGYQPYTQQENLGDLTFYARSAGDSSGLTATLRETVAHMDANLPVYDMKTMPAQVSELLINEELLTGLSLSFALLAALLAAVGLYGVMAYTVAQRTREVGIRVALGANRGSVIWLVLKDVLIMTGAGLLAGSLAAFFTSRFVESMLFGVKSNDPLAFAIGLALLAGVALAAGYVPARRAAAVNPITALRYE